MTRLRATDAAAALASMSRSRPQVGVRPPHIRPPAEAASKSASESVSSSQSSTDSAKSEPPICRADRTRISVLSTGSMMSQPFADIAVTNTGAPSCQLKGYPQIQAWGHRGWKAATQSVRLGIIVHHGVYERADNGPRRVVVQPRQAAYFSVGTATAYQGGLHGIIINRLSATLPGTQPPKALLINLPSTRPQGRRIHVGVTALRPAQK